MTKTEAEALARWVDRHSPPKPTEVEDVGVGHLVVIFVLFSDGTIKEEYASSLEEARNILGY